MRTAEGRDRHGFWGSNREVRAGLWFPSSSLGTRKESALPKIRDDQPFLTGCYRASVIAKISLASWR
jgi:hypothetical protein